MLRSCVVIAFLFHGLVALPCLADEDCSKKITSPEHGVQSKKFKLSSHASLLFYKGPMPDIEARVEFLVLGIHFVEDPSRTVVAIISQDGLAHEDLAIDYMPRSGEVLGGSRYVGSIRINSTTFSKFDGPAVQDKYFSEIFVLDP